MGNRMINKRTYYNIVIRLASPCCVSGGISDTTDSDVMRNARGECFIPGTSLAGAFRNYIEDLKNDESAFGYSKDEDGSMSALFISDLYFVSDSVKTTIRDRNKLISEEYDAGVDNKFDMEVIETGARGAINIEVVRRDGDQFDHEQMMEKLIFAMQSGEIRLGSIKNRGYGRVEVESIGTVVFDENNRKEWIDFLSGNKKNGFNYLSYEDWSQEKAAIEGKYIKISIPLKLTGGMIIRRYSAKLGEADYEHIKSNNDPVIPGTSWNGAIRAAAKRILLGLSTNGTKMNETDAEELISEWFGRVARSRNSKGSRQSSIVFRESVISDAVSIKMTRNNINRFTSGTKDGALYTEESIFGGHTSLEYMIFKDEKHPNLYLALQGMMDLIIKDICNGFVAIGGQVSIGRGILEGDPNKAECPKGRKALYEEVYWRMKK